MSGAVSGVATPIVEMAERGLDGGGLAADGVRNERFVLYGKPTPPPKMTRASEAGSPLPPRFGSFGRKHGLLSKHFDSE